MGKHSKKIIFGFITFSVIVSAYSYYSLVHSVKENSVRVSCKSSADKLYSTLNHTNPDIVVEVMLTNGDSHKEKGICKHDLKMDKLLYGNAGNPTYLPKMLLEKVLNTTHVYISPEIDKNFYHDAGGCTLKSEKYLLVLKHLHSEHPFISFQNLQCRMAFLRDAEEKGYIKSLTEGK